MTLLKRLQEEARKHPHTIQCNTCRGDGYDVIASMPDGEPEQVQCQDCHAEGKYHTLDTVDTLITNTVTAVLDEIEREVEAGDLTRKFMESLEHPTPEEYYAYNQGIADIKTIIKSKRTEV